MALDISGDRFKVREEFECRCLDHLNVNRELQDSHDCLKDIDVVDLLPSDPFDMETSGKRFARILIEEIKNESGSSSFGVRKDEKIEGKKKKCDFRGMNFVLKHSRRICPKPRDNAADGNEVESITSREKTDELMSFRQKPEEVESSERVCLDDDKGAPPDGLSFAFRYLGVKDLLSVQKACKSLRDAVRNDTLLWKNIHIDHPFSLKITDDTLLLLTRRAQGSLECLSVVRCPYITDGGVERVLRSNPKLSKLGVPGCGKVSVNGIISMLKALKSEGLLRIKHLRVGGLFNVTQKQFEELKSLLAIDNMQQSSALKPRFYQHGDSYLSFDDDRAIDIETCPRCQEARQVYDCPAESCHSKKQTCRGCTFCISRCNICGCCITERAYDETFVFDILCFDCLKPPFMRGINLYIRSG